MCRKMFYVLLVNFLLLEKSTADQCKEFTIFIEEFDSNTTTRLSQPLEFSCNSSSLCKELRIVLETDLPDAHGGNHSASLVYVMEQPSSAPLIAGVIGAVAATSAVAALGMMKLTSFLQSGSYRIPNGPSDIQFNDL